MTAPIPALAPVTTATLPSQRFMACCENITRVFVHSGISLLSELIGVRKRNYLLHGAIEGEMTEVKGVG